MGRPMTVQFTVDSHLASIIRAGVLWFDGATVVEHDHRLDAPLAAAEAAVRMNPPSILRKTICLPSGVKTGSTYCPGRLTTTRPTPPTTGTTRTLPSLSSSQVA